MKHRIILLSTILYTKTTHQHWGYSLIGRNQTCTPRTKDIKAKNSSQKTNTNMSKIKLNIRSVTLRMWVDMSTKPKQDTSFRTDMSILMNIPIGYI